jgi:hypothetical protein
MLGLNEAEDARGNFSAPINVVDSGYAVDWEERDTPNRPHNPYQPRSFYSADEF